MKDLDITKSIAAAYVKMQQPEQEEVVVENTPAEVEVEETEAPEQVEEAKKLDPVGKEDGDVDNDGDEDASDKYLKMRRKKISQAIKKEEAEPCEKCGEVHEGSCSSVKEVEEPRAKGEKEFKDKHDVKKTDLTPK
jgi:hypothetical protein